MASRFLPPRGNNIDTHIVRSEKKKTLPHVQRHKSEYPPKLEERLWTKWEKKSQLYEKSKGRVSGYYVVIVNETGIVLILILS